MIEINRAPSISTPRWVLQLLGWRLRFYAHHTLKLVKRRWQIMLLMLILLSPASMPLAAQIHAIATPVRQIVTGENPLHSLSIWLIGMLLMSAWVAVQPQALTGGAAWHYLQSLAAVKRWATAVDLTLLLIADLPLLLPFLAFAISAPPSNRAENIALTSLLALQWLLYQHLLLRRSVAALIVAATSLAATLLLSHDAGRLPAIGLVSVGLVFGLTRNNPVSAWAGLKPPKLWPPKLNPRHKPLANLILINLLTLMQQGRWPQWMATTSYAASVVWFGLIWREIGLQTHVAIALLVTSLLLPLFKIAGWQTCLRNIRQPLLPMLASLNLSRRTLLIADIGVLETCFCLLAVPSVTALLSVVGCRGFWLLPLGCMSLILLLPIYAYGNPSRLLPKLSIAVVFLYAGYSSVF